MYSYLFARIENVHHNFPLRTNILIITTILLVRRKKKASDNDPFIIPVHDTHEFIYDNAYYSNTLYEHTNIMI